MSIFQMFWYLGKVHRCLLVSSLFWPFIVSRCFQQWKNESVARSAASAPSRGLFSLSRAAANAASSFI